jgi:DNA-binding MarR family transcriptional regulator
VPSQAGDPLRVAGRVPTAEELSEATRRLDLALVRLNAAVARRLDLELMAITHVNAAGTLGPSELAHRIDVTTGAVTALVDRLTERGHLERRPHPSDRRRLLVHVTPHARDEVMRHVMPLVQDIRALASGFSDEERATIGRYLDGLIAVIERHARDDGGDA